jgi:lipoprotein-anchoring transpeptidase ErfK/SrfK
MNKISNVIRKRSLKSVSVKIIVVLIFCYIFQTNVSFAQVLQEKAQEREVMKLNDDDYNQLVADKSICKLNAAKETNPPTFSQEEIENNKQKNAKSKSSILISLKEQKLTLLDNEKKIIKIYPISTSKNRLSDISTQDITPQGSFLVGKKIGEDEKNGRVFRQRITTPYIWNSKKELPCALVLTRLIWLWDGSGENNKITNRYIYIHGTNRLKTLGKPASGGCIRMKNEDVVELFSHIQEGESVTIE